MTEKGEKTFWALFFIVAAVVLVVIVVSHNARVSVPNDVPVIEWNDTLKEGAKQ